jgi:hypothetical protein
LQNFSLFVSIVGMLTVIAGGIYFWRVGRAAQTSPDHE